VIRCECHSFARCQESKEAGELYRRMEEKGPKDKTFALRSQRHAGRPTEAREEG